VWALISETLENENMGFGRERIVPEAVAML